MTNGGERTKRNLVFAHYSEHRNMGHDREQRLHDHGLKGDLPNFNVDANMKKFGILAIALLLTGCDTITQETTNGYQMVPGLDGCKVFHLRSKTEQNLYVTRCPTTTSTHWDISNGKSTSHYDSTADNYDPNAETLEQAIERLNTNLAELYKQKAMQ
ncbi:hypothetical protein phiAS5_ORF0258 [Aeromonas phage phiAS5]|uniref:Uncharacterized protein n=1 Tax=Aeromonas phage phiAS5 TaxID=879630 RepID=E1A212_9CAUD|nr:hypothetical protein phiAS5_ORF0258 [Aeromonas phage phiAS5]ADM80101.1 hypothetical protein phiAS5_ORF0258 [Aeromonas phage phiAS5]